MQLVLALSEIAETKITVIRSMLLLAEVTGSGTKLVLTRDFGRELARQAIPAHIDELAPVFSFGSYAKDYLAELNLWFYYFACTT